MVRRSRFLEGSLLTRILPVMRKRLMKRRLAKEKLEGGKNRSRVSSVASRKTT